MKAVDIVSIISAWIFYLLALWLSVVVALSLTKDYDGFWGWVLFLMILSIALGFLVPVAQMLYIGVVVIVKFVSEVFFNEE